MKKHNKKIICINTNENIGYEQVIFVLRDEKDSSLTHSTAPTKAEPINFVLEAERIINQKLATSGLSELKQNATIKKDGLITQLIIRRSSVFDIWLNICLMLACLFLTGMLIFR